MEIACFNSPSPDQSSPLNERKKHQAVLFSLGEYHTHPIGKGFSRSNVAQIRQFYLRFPKIQTLSGQLSWSHYVEILKAEDELAIQFYAKQCEKESWSVRELKRQMKSCLNEPIVRKPLSTVFA